MTNVSLTGFPPYRLHRCHLRKSISHNTSASEPSEPNHRPSTCGSSRADATIMNAWSMFYWVQEEVNHLSGWHLANQILVKSDIIVLISGVCRNSWWGVSEKFGNCYHFSVWLFGTKFLFVLQNFAWPFFCHIQNHSWPSCLVMSKMSKIPLNFWWRF